MRLRAGHCAVDPRKIPYGSQLVFPDRTVLLAVDIGTAVRNRKAARKAGRTVNERSAIVVDRFFNEILLSRRCGSCRPITVRNQQRV
jgi:hypothetical protein